MFGSSSESEDELSQTAVARVFDLLPSDLQVDDSQRDAAASLQMTSEASGVESGAEQSEVRATSTDRVLRSRTRVKKDVNFIPEDENVSAYESFSSGESDGEVLDKEDEDDVCRDRGDRGEDGDVLSDNDAVQMDEAFVASLQVGGRYAGQVRGEAARGCVACHAVEPSFVGL
ncbi:hypothetical protein PI124_g8404 [Phytophthora idaei]|nr:hypothetical protein PI125_g8271 [Phytophthora idaei]KAG3159109.1 hypothetical protein PI126_g7559 [Phytophthora idaei]KAG3246879.1 hypothetical protein PI124_g8404 [Phytophthora idaei]